MGTLAGVGGAIISAAKGLVNVVTHPLETAEGLGHMISQSPAQNGVGYIMNLYSQYGNSGSDAFTNYAMGAHMLTDVAIALSPIKELIPGGGRSIWELNPLGRGFAAEKVLGGNLPKAFPVIVKFVNGVVTSIKSIDVTAASYTKGNGLLNTLKGHVNKLESFNGKAFGGVGVTESSIICKSLVVAIQPNKATLYQLEQIGKAMKYAMDNNI